MLQEEGSDGTLTKSKEADFFLPAVDCSEINLRTPGMLVIGKASMDAFHYVANIKFSNSFALNLPESVSKCVSSQLEFILQEAERQRKKA